MKLIKFELNAVASLRCIYFTVWDALAVSPRKDYLSNYIH